MRNCQQRQQDQHSRRTVLRTDTNAAQRIRCSNRDPAHKKCCGTRENATEGGAGASKFDPTAQVDMLLNWWRQPRLVVRSLLALLLLGAFTSALAQYPYSYAPHSPRYPPNGGPFASPVQGQPPPSMPQAMLEAHNVIRARVGAPLLVWSDDLAEVAQDWANHLIATGGLSHSPNNIYGENIYTISGGMATPHDVVDLWANEARGYDIRSNSCSGVCGHYTQIVWGKTRVVGCAVADAPRREIWVCNYDPPGNVIGYRPY
jgi:pathogenesis-related protein 1